MGMNTRRPTLQSAAISLTQIIEDEITTIVPTTKAFLETCCRTAGLSSDVSASEARDLLGVAPENNAFLDWLLEPLGDFTEQERTEVASFILGFPLMMKTRNNDGFIIGQRDNDDDGGGEDATLSSCAVLYPHSNNNNNNNNKRKKRKFFSSVSSLCTGMMSYHSMVKDGIRIPSFLHDSTKRGRFLKMVQHMDSESKRWLEQYANGDQDYLVLFQVGNSASNDNDMLEQIADAADMCHWPIYVTCSDEELRATLCDELGFTEQGTERVKDPMDETRSFAIYVMTRQPQSC